MYYNYHYSLLSEFERRHSQLNQNPNIEIIEFCKKQSDIVNEMEENRMLEKSVYNRFNQIEFINYIPLEIFKQVVNDLYFIYKKEIPFGDIKSFLKNNFNTLIYECEILTQNLEQGKVIWWDTLENVQFYNYSQSTYDYRMISWISKNNDDSHFYALYLKKIIEFLETELITEIENFERNLKIIIKTENIEPKKPTKTILDFIHNVNDKNSFLNDLKIHFPTEQGKSIKAIIDLLDKEGIIIYGTKEFKPLLTEIQLFFNRNLGTYQSVQNVKIVDSETIGIVYRKLKPLIIQHKTT
jgi:hypothetical protein